jgi:hypothetical protein
MTFKTIIGSRAEVWHGTAKHTSGGLTKTHLMKNKSGRIVSRKKHFSAKRENRLVKAGYKTKKGHFGFVKTGSKKHGRKHGRKHMKGGMPHDLTNSDSADHSGSGSGNNIAGAGITNFGDSSTRVQMRAGMAGGKRRKHHMVGGTSKGMMGRIEGSPLDATLTH